MPYYQNVAYTTTGTKDSLNLDPSVCPFNAFVAVNIGGGGNYKLQYTLSDGNTSDASAVWYDSGDIPSGTTTSATSALIVPISRIRLIIASITDTITLQVRQGLSIN